MLKIGPVSALLLPEAEAPPQTPDFLRLAQQLIYEGIGLGAIVFI